MKYTRRSSRGGCGAVHEGGGPGDGAREAVEHGRRGRHGGGGGGGGGGRGCGSKKRRGGEREVDRNAQDGERGKG